jgi:glycine cleavage system transcriptional repressor
VSEQYLVLTAVGTDRPGIVAELTALIAQRGANVADSRMAVLGGEFALMVLVSAPAEAAAALRDEIGPAAEGLGLSLVVKETRSPASHRAGRVRSYEVKVHALDHPGIVHRVTAALRELGGNIISLETSAYQAAVTGASLFRMELCADFPPGTTAARLRDALDQVSEAANADVEVQPSDRCSGVQAFGRSGTWDGWRVRPVQDPLNDLG